jgi:hypothetical protein
MATTGSTTRTARRCASAWRASPRRHAPPPVCAASAPGAHRGRLWLCGPKFLHARLQTGAGRHPRRLPPRAGHLRPSPPDLRPFCTKSPETTRRRCAASSSIVAGSTGRDLPPTSQSQSSCPEPASLSCHGPTRVTAERSTEQLNYFQDSGSSRFIRCWIRAQAICASTACVTCAQRRMEDKDQCPAAQASIIRRFARHAT